MSTKTGITWHADLSGEDGNAFVIMGVTHNAIKAAFGADWRAEAEEYSKRARSGDYENLLAVTREYITIVDHKTGFLTFDQDAE